MLAFLTDEMIHMAETSRSPRKSREKIRIRLNNSKKVSMAEEDTNTFVPKLNIPPVTASSVLRLVNTYGHF